MKEELMKFLEELRHEHELLSCEVKEKQARLTTLYLTIVRLEKILERNN